MGARLHGRHFKKTRFSSLRIKMWSSKMPRSVPKGEALLQSDQRRRIWRRRTKLGALEAFEEERLSADLERVLVNCKQFGHMLGGLKATAVFERNDTLTQVLDDRLHGLVASNRS